MCSGHLHPGTASTSITSCVCTASDKREETFPFGYYGRPGEPCYYCDTDVGWKCTENNLTLPMPDFGYWIDVCKPYPATKRECFPHHACEPIVAANISAMFQTNDNVSAAAACSALPVPEVVDGGDDHSPPHGLEPPPPPPPTSLDTVKNLSRPMSDRPQMCTGYSMIKQSKAPLTTNVRPTVQSTSIYLNLQLSAPLRYQFERIKKKRM